MTSQMLEEGIFRHPRPKKSTLPPLLKKRKLDHKIEEISFDTSAREDYLTGFHKRKVARTKQAQAEAAKKAKEEKIALRKQLREERKQELEEHVEAVNAILKEVNGVDSDQDNEEAWNGFEDEKAPVEVLDHEEEYIDEDRYTTVTVEAVDVSKEGLQKVVDEDDSDAEAPKLVESKDDKADDGKKKWPKKPRKKKFRYESKVERKLTRAKQKSSNKKRADARKGD